MSKDETRRKPYDVKVSILGTNYRVKFGYPKNDRFAGFCNSNNKEIYINLRQSDKQQKSTLLHECTHAFLHECGLQEYSHDETLVYALEILLPKMCKLFKNIGVMDE